MKLQLFGLLGLTLLSAALAASGSACDPVHSDEMAALGDEAPGVRTGPLHRPGQPCTVCHDGKLGSPPEFSVAGTIYKNATDAKGVASATVTMTDANGTIYHATTNEAGNFYASPNQFSPSYPMHVYVDLAGSPTAVMTSEIGRAGACSGCHVQPAGPSSPGQIFVPADGVLP